jgi:calcium-dependent protein kinase
MVRREQFGLGVDIWALGCVLYILLCGTHPFDPTGEAPEAQILARIVRADYDKTNEAYQSLSRSARDLMRHLLDVDPHTRYTAQQILMHPWLTERERNSDTPINTERLQGFRVLTLIKRGIPQLLAKAESDLFTIIDKDGDGFLTKPELAAALELIGVPVTPQELDAFLRLADSNSDGKVSREEFDTVLLAQFQGLSGNVQQKSSLQDLEALFCSFDRDEDGYISSDDLDHVLSLLGTAQAKSASGRPELEKADLDGDGRISFAEFVRFVRLTEEEKKDQVGSGMASTVLRIRDKRDVLKSRR